MKIVEVVHRYIYHTLYEFGLFTFKSDGFIVVALNAMLNDLKPTQSRGHLVLLTVYNQKIPYGIIFVQQTGAACTCTHN